MGGREAPGKTAFTQKIPQVGEVAIDPRDFGYGDYYDLAKQINPGKGNPDTPEYPNSQSSLKKIGTEQQGLKNANITIAVTPSDPKGFPSGIPSTGPYSATDAISPPQPNVVDVYRTKTIAQADQLGRIRARGVVSFDPSGRVRCPG